MNQEHQDEVSRDAVLKRLKRIEGQVRGLQKMVSEERGCESIITQLAAVRSAIDSTGALVLNNYMHLCFLPAEATDTAEAGSASRTRGSADAADPSES